MSAGWGKSTCPVGGGTRQWVNNPFLVYSTPKCFGTKHLSDGRKNPCSGCDVLGDCRTKAGKGKASSQKSVGQKSPKTGNTLKLGTLPATPGRTMVVSATTSSLNVTWTAVSGATSYKLEVQTGNTWTTIYSGNATTFSHTGLNANTSYTYRVSAENANGSSAVSSTQSGITASPPTVQLQVSLQ